MNTIGSAVNRLASTSGSAGSSQAMASSAGRTVTPPNIHSAVRPGQGRPLSRRGAPTAMTSVAAEGSTAAGSTAEDSAAPESAAAEEDPPAAPGESAGTGDSGAAEDS